MERIVNRHIARLLNKLEPLNIPNIGKDTIKHYMWLLARDLDKGQGDARLHKDS